MYAAINIFGLSMGISACLIIYLIARFEFSFDNFHTDKERIFRIVSDSYSVSHGEDHSSGVPDPAPFSIRKEVAGLQSLAVFYNYEASVTIPGNGLMLKKFDRPERGVPRSDILIAESEYFNIFQYKWLEGSPIAALNNPYTVVLTQSKANLYFGKLPLAEIIGKTIIYNDSLQVTVTGIVQDYGKNTDFYFNDFISFETIKNSFLKNEAGLDDWIGYHPNHQVFVKLNKDVAPSRVNTQLAAFVKNHLKQEPGQKTEYHLQPLSTIHTDLRYSDVYSRKANLPTLYGLMAIAFFILVIALINFITLSAAQAADQAKESGIRKICGSSRASLIIRFLTHTFVLTLLAILLSLSSIYPILSAFRSFIPPGVTFSFFSISTWLFLLSIALFTTFFGGFYPAKLVTSLAPTEMLKESILHKPAGKGYFIKSLIVFQFTISLFFIIGTIVVVDQIRFMINKDPGFKKDAIITVNTNEGYAPSKKDVLAEKIRQLPEVALVSISDGTPAAKDHWMNPLIYRDTPERSASCILEWGDEHFIPLFGIKLIAGNNISASDTAKEFLINATCAKTLGFKTPEDAIGKYVETIVPPGAWIRRPIVGVMADFHSQSLHEPIKPVFITSSKQFASRINIKLRTTANGTGNFKTFLSKTERLWKETYPNELFKYNFFDNTIASFYETEQQTAQLMTCAMMAAICISCLGLFGLVTLTARQRTKEIGIRKVLGAGVAHIIFLISRDTIKLVLIAILIASPIAFYGMHRWLQGFAFRISISWWIFTLSGLAALFIACLTVGYQTIKAAMANPANVLRNR